MYHSDLYNAIGFKYTSEHHPNDHDFHINCDGFRRFLKEVTEEQLNKLTEAINIKNNEFCDACIISAPLKSTPQVSLCEGEGYIEINNKVYKVVFNEISNVKTINDLVAEITKKYTDMVNIKINSIHRTYNQQIAMMKKIYQEELSEAFCEGIKVLKRGSNWKIYENKLTYKKTIIPTMIKKDDELYLIPEDDNPFYIEKFNIPIKPKIYRAYAADAFHPNVGWDEDDECWKVCLGTLDSESISKVMVEAPEMLKTINLDSAYDNDAKDKAYDIIDGAEPIKEMDVWYI